MKNLLLVIVSLCLLYSCKVKTGSGNIEKQSRQVSSFSAVSAGGGFEVFIRQGSSNKVTIEADDNIINDIETEVSGSKLKIRFKDNISVNSATVRVYVETPELSKVSASAAADIKVEGLLKSGKTISFNASSAGSINAEIDAPAVETEASSSGSVTLKGHTKDLDTQASSGGSIEAKELLSENAKAQASSGASINLHASVKLNAQASSGGSVNYRGNPSVSKQESSGGSISASN